MDLVEAKCYLCLIALCCGPTQEDADFVRSLGTLLRVPSTEQASSITMLTAVSRSSNPLKSAEELALKVRCSLDQEYALEQYCMLFLLCFQPAGATKTGNQNKKELAQLYQHVQFNARTSVIFRRLAFLLRIKLSTVAALEESAVDHWKHPSNAVSSNAASTPTTTTNNSKKDRRKGIIRGLKIGAAATGAGVLLGVTGGLAAPALAAGLAHIGLGAAAAVTTTATVAAFLGAGGAGLAGYKMNRRTKGVKHFVFQRINATINDQPGGGKPEEHNGMTVYICVSGYLRRPGPVTPNKTESATDEDENNNNNMNNSGRRRFSFRRGNSSSSNNSNSNSNTNSEDGRRGRSSSSQTITSTSASSSILAMHPKSSAANSPEFHEPWGSQPPLLFPEQVLDRYYAMVAPEKRSLVPMLLSKYRKKYKSQQQRKNILRQGGDQHDQQGQDNTDESQDILSYLGFDEDEDTTTSATTGIGGAEEKLYSLLEKEYGIHPLQLVEAATSPLQEQQELDQAKTQLYQALLQKGQIRLEALLSGGGGITKSTIGEQLPRDQVTELMHYQRPWDSEFVFEYLQEQEQETVSVSTMSTLQSDDDEKDDDVPIPLDDSNTDEEQVLKIIEDLNSQFEEMDHMGNTSSSSNPPNTPSPQTSQESSLLQEELDRLELDSYDANSNSSTPSKRKLMFQKKTKKMTKKMRSKNETMSDIYWWKESIARYGDQFTLVWEPNTLLECGCCVENLIKESASKGALSALQFTALAPIMLTVALPVVIMSVVIVLDNYWSVATAAADEAGELLADALLSGAHGNRPVVLIGYSVGARVVASCLKALAKVANSEEEEDDDPAEDIANDGIEASKKNVQGKEAMNEKLRKYKQTITNSKARKSRAKNIVRDAVIIGAPLNRSLKSWTRRRSVVQGRLINVYNPKDWVLALLYRYKSWSVVSLAGLQPVHASPVDGLPDIENYNVSDIVGGHGEYHAKVREILDRVGIGDVNCEHAHSHYFATAKAEEETK